MTAREKWRQLVGMFKQRGSEMTPEMMREFLERLEASLPTRDQWIAVNVEFDRILAGRGLIVDVGQAPKDGTGDRGRDGMQKILDNLRQVPTPQPRRYSDHYSNDRCDCSCADPCPLGRVGSSPRCTAAELRAALIKRMNPSAGAPAAEARKEPDLPLGMTSRAGTGAFSFTDSIDSPQAPLE